MVTARNRRTDRETSHSAGITRKSRITNQSYLFYVFTTRCEDLVNMQSPSLAMVTLDKMLAMSNTVDWLGLTDIGQLGPAVRYSIAPCT